MTLILHLPEGTEATFQRAFGSDLDRVAVEALAVEGYRGGKLSLGEVAKALGLATSILAAEWLGTRGVPLNYSLEDLESDRRTLERIGLS